MLSHTNYPASLRMNGEVLYHALQSYPVPGIKPATAHKVMRFSLFSLCTTILSFNTDVEQSSLLPLLRSLNDVLRRVAENDSELCRVVTGLLQDNLLMRYESSRNERVKDEIILLLRLQLSLHISSTGRLLPLYATCDISDTEKPLAKPYTTLNERTFLSKMCNIISGKYWSEHHISGTRQEKEEVLIISRLSL
tara:strand:+ start:76 stop:657 length:582 start_codon:yes stop_codon:yes gene_type:complete